MVSKKEFVLGQINNSLDMQERFTDDFDKDLHEVVKELTHARHDPAHCMSGLFQSIPKGERKKVPLDISYKFGRKTVQFIGYQRLGVDDMRIQQGIVALAGAAKPRKKIRLDGLARTTVGKKLAKDLKPKDDAVDMKALYVQTTSHELLRAVGYQSVGDKAYQRLKASLLRQGNMQMVVESGRKLWSTNLLSFFYDGDSAELHIGLNPLVTQAVLGKTRYSHLDLMEIRLLKSDATRLIHQRLSAFIDSGDSKNVSLDTLTSYVWSDKAKSASTTRTRRAETRKAMKELDSIGWLCSPNKRGIYQIMRPHIIYNED